MRIALAAPFGLRAKGTTRARVLPLARALAEKGHSVSVFIPPYDSPEDSGQVWEEDEVLVVNVALPHRWPRAGMLWHLGVAWRLLYAVRRWKPDLVHVFKPKGPSGLVGTAVYYLPSCRLVVDSDDWEGPGGWNDDPRAAYSPLERRFFAWQERYGLSHANAWTVTGGCLRERAISFGADPMRVFLLPNGVTIAPDRRSSDGEEEASPVAKARRPPTAILYTRFAGVKVEDVIAIWERVRSFMPDARLTVVGQGLGGEERSLQDVAGVDVHGWVEQRSLPAFFAGADLAIVPWSDMPSNRARHSAKVLELMAAGVPIVAYAVGELPATLGDSAILVAPGDREALARAVVELCRDCEMAHRLGQKARQRALTEYSWSHLGDIALAAYRAAQEPEPIWKRGGTNE
jgi:glycosyltransferase involved in cell wall biosynthesis